VVSDVTDCKLRCSHLSLFLLSHSLSLSPLPPHLQALDGFLMVTQIDGTIVFLSESIHKHMGLFQVNNQKLSILHNIRCTNTCKAQVHDGMIHYCSTSNTTTCLPFLSKSIINLGSHTLKVTVAAVLNME
jgi:hypothetical protein